MHPVVPIILGALAGTFAAAKLSRRAGMAVVVGALLLTAAILNMTSLPHPLWFWVAGGGHLPGDDMARHPARGGWDFRAAPGAAMTCIGGGT